MGLKDRFNKYMKGQKAQRQVENVEKGKRVLAYKEEYNKARIEGAKRAGRREGLARGSQRSSGHGILASLGQVGQGMDAIGQYGKNMQANLLGDNTNILGLGSSRPSRRRKRK